MSIGENIKRLRVIRGIQQVELAEKLGISQSMLCQIERGTKAVTLPLGKQIAEILDCTVDDFLEEENAKV